MAAGLTTMADADFRAMNRVRVEGTVFIGVDLGKLGSASAIVVLERLEEWPGALTEVLRGEGPRKRYVVRQAERFALGTEYRLVVLRLKQVVERVQAMGRTCIVVVDEGGPGVPVVERMREVGMGCSILGYMITSGEQASGRTVPRALLLTKMQLMMQSGELEIAAGCRDGEQLERELVNLQLRKRASGGGGGGESDDLALALALACWKARVR